MNNFLKYISVIYFVLSTSAYAAWPDKTLKIVVPYGPGGGVDTFARPLTVKMGEQLGNPFVVDNKAGAGGTIGVLFAAKSAPDGYTFLAGAVHQTMSESLYPKRGYDFDKDFIPVALTAIVPNVLVINPKLPFKNAGELISFARENPDKLTYCDASCYNVYTHITQWMNFTPEFQVLIVLVSSPVAQLVALWGMTSKATLQLMNSRKSNMQEMNCRATGLSGKQGKLSQGGTAPP